MVSANLAQCHETGAEKTYLLASVFLLGVGGAIYNITEMVASDQTAVGVGVQNVTNLNFAKFWNRRFVLEIQMFRFHMKFEGCSHHGHKCCLLGKILASNMFFVVGYLQHHHLRQIKFEELMAQI